MFVVICMYNGDGVVMKNEPDVAALIFKDSFTAASKNSATLAKSSSKNPLEVRAGVPTEERVKKNSQ